MEKKKVERTKYFGIFRIGKFQSGSNNVKITFIQSFSEYPKFISLHCVCVLCARYSGEKKPWRLSGVLYYILERESVYYTTSVRRLNKFMYMNAAKWKTTQKPTKATEKPINTYKKISLANDFRSILKAPPSKLVSLWTCLYVYMHQIEIELHCWLFLIDYSN